MFLATTAIEEFWNKEDEIIFLGEWCKLYTRKEEWSSLNYKDFPFIWNSSQKVEEAILSCTRIYKAVLKELTIILNDYHGIQKSAQFYHIVMGSGLNDLIHQLYDKYQTVKRVLAVYPTIETYILDEKQHYIPVDFHDYNEKVKDDLYSLQIYSQIFKKLGCGFPSRTLNFSLNQGNTYHLNKNESWKYQLFFRLTRLINSIFYKRSVTITGAYFSYDGIKNIIKLLSRGKFKYVFDDMRYEIKIKYTIDRNFRRNKKLALKGGEFECILSELIIENLPILFLEGFRDFRNKVLALPIKKSHAYFTAISLHSNYIFKFFLAENYDRIKILNIQHGGGFGIFPLLWAENYERSISDWFYTWGWTDGSRTKPLPHPKLLPETPLPASDQILFVMDCLPRYVYRLFFKNISTLYLNSYLNSVIAFLKRINQNSNLLVRSYFTDRFKWFEKERIADCGISFKFDNFKKNLRQRMKESSICVYGDMSTTYQESLAMNIPTVIFIDPEVFRFLSSAEPYIDILQKAKILHFSPESASEHVNTIRRNVEDWWLKDRVQSARKAWVERYARADSEWPKLWIDEFERILNQH
jgi:putative transferase (TIGR04331 family)